MPVQQCRVDTFSGYLLFGAHKNKPLSSPTVPTDYLCWVMRAVSLMDDEREAVKQEINRRLRGDSGGTASASGAGRPNAAPPPPPPPKQAPPPPPYRMVNVPKDDLLKVIAAGRQALAKRLHPDAGGDTEAMTAVNRAADYLEHIARAT